MRNNHGQQGQQRGQGNRPRQQGQGTMRGHQGQGRQQYGGPQQGYENPESRFREQSPSSGWRSQSGDWEEEDLRGYSDEFRNQQGSEQQRWDRWNDDENFAEQQYGENRDQFGDQGARGYYGGSGGNQNQNQGYGAGRFGFTGQGEFDDRGGQETTGGRYGNFGRQSGFGNQSQGSQSYGGMGWRGERSQSGMGMGNMGGMGMGGMGQRDQQQRFNRGPKGYKRSDERIKEDVSDRISQLHDVDASDVEIDVKAGEVTLTGSVPTRNMKWQLETLIDTIAGVTEVHNQLRIKREGSMTSGTESERSTGMGEKPSGSSVTSSPLSTSRK